MRWTRDEYLDYMTFQPRTNRQMFVELFGPLVGLPEEWRAQGAADDEIKLTAFDWDFVETTHTGARCFAIGPASVVIEDTPTRRVERDMLGRTLVLDKRTATIPLPTDFPVRCMDDWLKYKPMFTFRPERIRNDAIAAARRGRDEGKLCVIGIPGAFDSARELMGEEMACMGYYDQPELMHDILSTMHDTARRVLEWVCEQVTVDQLSVHEDFAGRSGPMVGPAQIAEYFGPYYREMWGIVRSKGGRIFQLDTDGNINAVVEDLLACGLTSIFPMEPAAGMDIVQLRRQYGNRLMMLGGIDKHALRKGKEDIRRELEYKLSPEMRGGGMVFALDHRIPNGTPIENYRYYANLGREMLGLEPLDGARRGWRRMAF